MHKTTIADPLPPSPQEREAVSSELSSAEDWLYEEENMALDATAYKARPLQSSPLESELDARLAVW